MNKSKMRDYLLIAIDCMVQTNACFEYSEQDALNIALEDIGMSQKEYESLLKSK